MCQCTPSIKTPFCGRPGCEWPPQTPRPSREERTAAYHKRLALIRESLRRNDVEWAAMDIEWLLDELDARERQVRMIAEVFKLDAESVGRLMWVAARGGDPTAEEFVALEEKRRVSLTVFAHALLLALNDRVRDCTMERARALTLAAKIATPSAS